MHFPTNIYSILQNVYRFASNLRNSLRYLFHSFVILHMIKIWLRPWAISGFYIIIDFIIMIYVRDWYCSRLWEMRFHTFSYAKNLANKHVLVIRKKVNEAISILLSSSWSVDLITNDLILQCIKWRGSDQ